MKSKRILSFLLAIVMAASTIPHSVFAASSTYQLVAANTVELDGETDQSVDVYFQSINAETTYSLEADWSVTETEGTSYLTLTTLTAASGANATENNASNGHVYWTDATYTGVETVAGGTIWTATYTVDKDTPAGTYTVSLTGKTTDSTFGENNFGTLTATITVTEHSAPPAETADFEIWYELNGSTFNGTGDNDTYTDYNIGDTVTATVYIKNNGAEAINLQAYDIYLTYADTLIYRSQTLTSGMAFTNSEGKLTHIQAVGADNTNTPISVALPADTDVSLGTITFTISEDVVYDTQMLIDLTDATNISVGTDASGDPASYKPAETSTVEGAEVMTTYTVSFDTDGGTTVADQTVGYKLTATKPVTDPTKDNYTFKGWYTDSTYATEFNFAYTQITGDTTVYAKWEQDTFKVYWYNTDGTEIYNTNVNAGATTSFDETKYSKPTKDADKQYTYNFKGWSTDSNAALNAEVVDLVTYEINAETRFYPVFSTTTNTYTVTWNNWDNSLLEKDENVEYGTTPTYNGSTPTKASTEQYEYTFDKWTPSVSEVTGNITYTATFTEKTRSYTVTYAAGTNGTLAGNTTETVEYGKAPASIPTVTPANGYEFTGWSDGTNTYTDLSNYTVSGAVTLTAQYELVEYTITLNVNGGDAINSNTITYKITDTVTLPAATKTGATFGGWKLEAAVGGWEAKTYNAGEYSGKYGTITLVAQWTNDNYTITTGSVIGGTVTPSKSSANYGDEITLTNDPKDGYEFVSYTVTDASSNSVTVTDGKFTMPASNVTVSATFNPIDYTVTIGTISNGSVEASKTTQVHVGDEITLTPTAAKGYRLASYTVTDAFGNSVTVTDGKFTMPASNVTVTATFTGIPYEIKFDCNGGNQSTMSSISTAYGETVTLTQNVFTKTGYTFLGWSTDPNATVATHVDKAEVSNLSFDGTPVTLYAIWQANTNTKYVVNHYKQDVDVANNQVKDSYTLADDEELTGTSDAEITPAVKTYEGFTAPGTQTVTIKADGTTVVNYYYTRNTYTVILDANYDEGADSSITVIYGGTYAALADVTRAGYTFNGWFDAATGGNEVKTTTAVKTADDHTLYAHWTPVEYTITFNANGGTAIGSMNYTIVSTEPLPAATGNGLYTFAGWKVSTADGSWTLNDVLSAGELVTGYYGNVTLTAQWAIPFTYDVAEYGYVSTDYVMLRIATDSNTNCYAVDGVNMYYTDDENYKLNGKNVFVTLIPASYVSNGVLTTTAMENISQTAVAAIKIERNGDINGDGVVNIADANIVYQMVQYGGAYYTDLSSDTQTDILARLKADMSTASADHRASIDDVEVIVNIINGVNN